MSWKLLTSTRLFQVITPIGQLEINQLAGLAEHAPTQCHKGTAQRGCLEIDRGLQESHCPPLCPSLTKPQINIQYKKERHKYKNFFHLFLFFFLFLSYSFLFSINTKASSIVISLGSFSSGIVALSDLYLI